MSDKLPKVVIQDPSQNREVTEGQTVPGLFSQIMSKIRQPKNYNIDNDIASLPTGDTESKEFSWNAPSDARSNAILEKFPGPERAVDTQQQTILAGEKYIPPKKE